MSKEFPPDDYDQIGDPTRTEGTFPEIIGAGGGRTFRKENETFSEMHQRRESSQDIPVKESTLAPPNQPKNYFEKGDSTRTEKSYQDIIAAEKGGTYQKENEDFREMHQRRESAKSNSIEDVQSNKPDLFKEAIKRESSTDVPSTKVNEIAKVQEVKSNEISEVESNKPNLFHEAVKKEESKTTEPPKDIQMEKEHIVEKNKSIDIDKEK